MKRSRTRLQIRLVCSELSAWPSASQQIVIGPGSPQPADEHAASSPALSIANQSNSLPRVSCREVGILHRASKRHLRRSEAAAGSDFPNVGGSYCKLAHGLGKPRGMSPGALVSLSYPRKLPHQRDCSALTFCAKPT
jgi:hypothetical protein